MSVDAVRGRIRRGTLDSERDGGTVYVYVDAEPTDRRSQSAPVDRPAPDEAPASIVEELRDRIRYLERQVEEEKEARKRADTILAQLSRANEEQARTIRVLEAPQEPQNEPERAESRSDRGTAPPTAKSSKPWYLRLLGR